MEHCKNTWSARKTGSGTSRSKTIDAGSKKKGSSWNSAFSLVPIADGPKSTSLKRSNGRTFRIVQGRDRRWTLYRVNEIGDKGELLGTYQGRGDANKALKKIAYASEPR